MKKIMFFAATLFIMAFCSNTINAQNIDNTNKTLAKEIGINEIESNRIFVTMYATFKNEERCKVAMETIVNDAHAAYGVNSHFWFISDDGKTLFVLEQYEDKKALRKAVRRFTSARMSFFRSIKDYKVSIYGDPSPGSKFMFSAFRPPYMNYYGGYSKLIAENQEAGIKSFERDRILVATNAKFKDEEKCKVAMEELVKKTYAESGTKTHYYFISKDGKSLFLLEQYEDEKAFEEHLITNSSSRARLFESIEVDDLTVYGTESDKVKEFFDTFNPTYMSYYGGYSK